MALARSTRLALVTLLVAAGISSPSPVTAASTPRAQVAPNTCAEGLGTAHIKLFAADGEGSTFKTLLRSNTAGEVFRDEGRTVDAGQQESVAIPGLFYGDYDLEVFADGERILRDSLFVGCVPERAYKRPSLFGFQGCDRDSTYVIRNSPIKGAEHLLEPVHFVIAVKGVKKLLETDLPDTAGDPYEASVTVYWDDYEEPIVVTADGVEIPVEGWAVPGCIETPEPPLPNTGG